MADALGLLCARRKRPRRRRRAAEQNDELAPPHVLSSGRGPHLTTSLKGKCACASQQKSDVHVCFGSEADMALLNFDVRFTPKSGRWN
jgi:hypothetical protein